MASTVRFTGSPAASGHLKLAGVDRDMQPRFSANALIEDLRLAHAARRDLHAETPLMDCALEEYERAIEAGVGGEDYIAAALTPRG